MKALFFILLTLLSLMSPAMAERVRYVIDGDTFILEDGIRVRLAGIDAPELSQPYGQEARAYLDKLVTGREINLACNGMSYNRKLCKAYVMGLDIQKELVGWGLAFDYTQYSGGVYKKTEDFARYKQRGVWDGGVRPWVYRRMNRKEHHANNDNP